MEVVEDGDGSDEQLRPARPFYFSQSQMAARSHHAARRRSQARDGDHVALTRLSSRHGEEKSLGKLGKNTQQHTAWVAGRQRSNGPGRAVCKSFFYSRYVVLGRKVRKLLC